VYTDGVTEARHAGGFYGETRLVEALSLPGRSVTALTEALLDDVLRFQSGSPRDDIAIVAISVPAEMT
jgi:phosphoserine phosphatase RsbU/P